MIDNDISYTDFIDGVYKPWRRAVGVLKKMDWEKVDLADPQDVDTLCNIFMTACHGALTVHGMLAFMGNGLHGGRLKLIDLDTDWKNLTKIMDDAFKTLTEFGKDMGSLFDTLAEKIKALTQAETLN
jgi:hypothetical protein